MDVLDTLRNAAIDVAKPPLSALLQPPQAADKPLRLDVRWARHLDEVRQVQRLRHAVFAAEMGAVLQTPLAGHDIDAFDDFCEHLMVCDADKGVVIGTYRLLTPTQALRAGACTPTRNSTWARSPPGARAWWSWAAAACTHRTARAA